MNFNEFKLDPRLLQGIKKAGYETATSIQEAAIPAALRGRDIISTVQTGIWMDLITRFLPRLNRLLDVKEVHSLSILVAHPNLLTPQKVMAEIG